jgi:hypothetical protein
MMFVGTPKGVSCSSLWKLCSNLCGSIKWCSGESTESEESCVQNVFKHMERRFPDTFLDVCQELGYFTQQSKVMSAEYWTAMTEAANLLRCQSRTINQYLTGHFRTCVCVPEKLIEELTLDYVPYNTKTIHVAVVHVKTKKVEVQKVVYSFKNLAYVLAF